MDPFEEFEFKPLTDGLGFHKKKPTAAAATPIEETPASDPFAKNTLKTKGLELIEEPSTDPLRPPLPRKGRTPLPSAPGNLTEVGGDGTPSTTAVDEILKTLQKNRRLDFDISKEKISQTKTQVEFKKSTWSFSAAILDTMLVVAASLLCMIVVLIATKADLIGNLTNPDGQGMIYLSLLSVLAGVCFIYLVGNRIFVGCTPGEWAFDQCVGKPEELNTTPYTVSVVLRSLLVIATGFITLPILSVLMNKDIAGNLTGARLYKKA
jgi:hypothetical protein